MKFISGIESKLGRRSCREDFCPSLSNTYLVYDTTTKTEEPYEAYQLDKSITGVVPYKNTFLVLVMSDLIAKTNQFFEYTGFRYNTDGIGIEDFKYIYDDSGLISFYDKFDSDNKFIFNIGEAIFSSLIYESYSIPVDINGDNVDVFMYDRVFTYRITNLAKFNAFITKCKLLNKDY
jgi:hypothetical protein